MNIFVDGSYSPQKKIGVGAYLIVTSNELSALRDLPISELKIRLVHNIVYMEFRDAHGSTDVEQRILKLALSQNADSSITVYTDCQKTQSTNKYITVHIKGHTKQSNRKGPEKIFDVVDKAVRKRLRKIVKDLL